VLGALALDHRALALIQQLAWLFRDPGQSAAVAQRDLAELSAEDVADAELLALLPRQDPRLELLRCAVELERPAFETLPPADVDRAGLTEHLQSVLPAAPALGACRVAIVRALGLRGRVRGDEIWIGARYDAAGAGPEHAAWQAAHEATVREVEQRAESLGADSERAIEEIALVLLAARALRTGLSSEHARWFAHFEGRAGTLAAERLPAASRVIFEELLRT
jgi:hypothetical protein